MSVFYSGQSGRPYTLTYNNDANGDNRVHERPRLHPDGDRPLTYSGGTYTDLLDFINGDECLAGYVGQIIPRNACRVPWTEHARRPLRDPAAVQALSGGDHARRAQPDQHVRLGQRPVPVRRRSGRTRASARCRPRSPRRRRSPATTSRALTAPNFTRFLRDDLRSRWQIQLGARLRF